MHFLNGRQAVMLMTALALSACNALAAADVNPDYATAVAGTGKMAAGLLSYTARGKVEVSSGPAGQVGPVGQSIKTVASAQWPDRLASTQSGPQFAMNLGTGPEQSWFYMGQIGNAYVGGPVALTRDLAGADGLELSAEKIFNFYGGLGPFLLPADLSVAAETGADTVTANGHMVPCQVFTTVVASTEVGESGSAEGPRRFHYDPVSGLVLVSERVVYFNRNGTKYEQQIRFVLDEYALNGEVDPRSFSFTPPAGVRVVNSLEKLTNPDAMTGQVAPDITFTDLSGETYQLSDLRGTPVFVDFWATWCPPCRAEMPHIQALYEELGVSAERPGGQIRILGASSEDTATVQAFIAKNKYSFPIATVPAADALSMFKTTSIPTGFVIDAEGVIRAHLVGGQTAGQLRAAFAKAGVK